MSDNHAPEHNSLIKTPKQLLIVVVLAFVVPVIVIITLAQLALDGKRKPAPTAASEEAVARRIKPVGEVVVAAATAGAQEGRSGKAVYESVCAVCHAAGVLNAPKFGDKQAWAKPIAQGQDVLTTHALQGVRQMPARGGNPNLSDIEIARTVVYLANQAGANWKEPVAPPAPAAAPAATPVAAAAPAPAAAAPAPAAGAAAKGKSIYESSCVACHAAGIAGAPKAGDKAAWAPRLKTGKDALYASALKGKGAMPPKGGNMALPDADVKAAVDYLTGLAK
jgi:cytochrome c5